MLIFIDILIFMYQYHISLFSNNVSFLIACMEKEWKSGDSLGAKIPKQGCFTAIKRTGYH